jgi:hypothetical protein
VEGKDEEGGGEWKLRKEGGTPEGKKTFETREISMIDGRKFRAAGNFQKFNGISSGQN